MNVAFLGLGRMGVAMASHVLAAGHELAVWNRTAGRANGLVQAGAREATTVADAVGSADRIVMMLFGPDSVAEVLPHVVEAAPRGALVVDATTIGPEAARAFAAQCRAEGVRYADAPVAGSVKPATEGTLGVFVGCDEADWPEVRDLVSLWGDEARVRRVGDVGAGSALKLCVNQGIGVLAAGLGESLRLGASLGLDRAVLLDVLGGTAYGWTLAQKRTMLERGEFPAAFSLELLAKDLALALAAGADMPVTRAALDHCRDALAAGHEGEDHAAVIAHVAERSR